VLFFFGACWSLGAYPVDEAELWVMATRFMAFLGFLLFVQLLLWLKHGFGSGNAAFKNKIVAPRSLLLGSGYNLDEVSTNRGGEGGAVQE
jgi:hypothetical protein